jgi:hypothetical protein
MASAMSTATGLDVDYGYFDYDWQHALKTSKATDALNFVNGASAGTTIWLITIVRNFMPWLVFSLFEYFHQSIYGIDRINFNRSMLAAGENERSAIQAWRPKLFAAELETMLEQDLMNQLLEYQDLILQINFNSQVMKQIIGVDLGEVPFDHDQSRQFLSLRYADGKQINVIGLRYEDLSKWPTILRDYFPSFPEVMPEEKSWSQGISKENLLLKVKYKELKEYLDGSGYFTTLSLEELRSYPNHNYYTDCEVKYLAHVGSKPLPMQDSAHCSTTSYPKRQGKRPCDSSHQPKGKWKEVPACFNRSQPSERIAETYCSEAEKPSSTSAPTPSPTIYGHWVITAECQNKAGKKIHARNCPKLETDDVKAVFRTL